MNPSEHTQCKYCEQVKIKKMSGKVLKDKTKIFTDEHNRRWAGQRCPECERKRVKEALKYDQFERKIIFEKMKKMGWLPVEEKSSFPLKFVREQENTSLKIIHATTSLDGQVVLEDPIDFNAKDSVELYALVFHTVRVVSKEQALQHFS